VLQANNPQKINAFSNLPKSTNLFPGWLNLRNFGQFSVKSYGCRLLMIAFTRYMYRVWQTTKSFSSHLWNTMLLFIA